MIQRIILFSLLILHYATTANASSAVALHGLPKYQNDFKHFNYVNPNAPIGGEITIAGYGTFDTVNPFLLKGVAAGGLMGNVFETLMTASADEPFSRYGLIASDIAIKDNQVTFTINPKAKFADNTTITADDVVFSFNSLKKYGQPSYRSYYREVISCKAIGKRHVIFTLQPDHSRELPLILGDLPVISKTYYTTIDFNKTTLIPPLSSGPYKITKVEAGRYITLQRRDDYWGWKLPVNVGMYNFNTIKIQYYRDSMVALEAFKGGDHDVRIENIAKLWATAYSFPAIKNGDIIVKEIEDGRPAPIQGFIMNLRRGIFQDRNLRQALAMAFDFDWINKTMFYGAYRRTYSYFGHTDLSARGLPSDAEIKLLQPYRKDLPPELFTTEFTLPQLSTTADRREAIIKADTLLDSAGWIMKNGVRINKITGKPLIFEMLLDDSTFERVAAPFAQNLKKLGITMTTRIVDSAQYQKRLQAFDYDITPFVYPVSLSPGNEQVAFWGSAFADVAGSQNIMGIKNPIVDKLINDMLRAQTRQELQTITHAIDRVLLWQYNLIHHWRLGKHRVAYRSWLQYPENIPPFDLGMPTTWWDSRIK